MNNLSRFLPFLRWFPLRQDALKADLVAGITVALVLIPQSMAYAQLAGMPAYYGLYAGFLPVAVAALFGSSNFLGTGPVAVVSLLTASSLAVLAPPGSEQFIVMAILLALLVGIFQLALGILKLGVIVNFLSHPVIVGFTNAAALIIGLSQVSKLFGVPMGRSESFMKDIWGVLQQLGDTHLPTLGMGVLALAIMWALKKYRPKWPGVLIAVVLTTLLSWGTGFERNSSARMEDVQDPEAQALMAEFERTEGRIDELTQQLSEKSMQLKVIEKEHGGLTPQAATVNYEIELLKLQLRDREQENRNRNRTLRSFHFERVVGAEGFSTKLYAAAQVPPGLQSDGRHWRISKVKKGELKLVGGGEVVGKVPQGLPSIAIPKLDLDSIRALLAAAIVISLVGFMEAISIAKALAAKAKQKVDPNQELIGQGLANVIGAFTQAFPVSGSFSRSAVNFDAGAVSGLSSVITTGFVLITLLFLTPLLYHLPQAVLAAIIIMAIVGLVNFKAVEHAWKASRHDGVAAGITFVATLVFAPHLDNGILVGAGLAIVLFLYRTMKPRVAVLGRHSDGTLRDTKVHPTLPTSPHVIAMRFDGQLYFANVAYFEDNALELVAAKPDAKYLLVVGDGINHLDASGEEVVHHLVERLRGAGVEIVFAGLKKQVLSVMHSTGLFDLIGQANIFPTEHQAIVTIYQRLGVDGKDDPFYNVRA